MSARPRVLLLSSFPPTEHALNGGAKETGRLALALAPHADVTVACLRDDDAVPADERLAHHGVRVHEVVHTGRRGPRRALRAVDVAAGWLRGEPRWVSHLGSRELACVARGLVAEWRPDLVQLEHTVMGAYLRQLEPDVRRVLRPFEPASTSAREQIGIATGLRRAAATVDLRLWPSFERSVVASVDAVAALTERDSAAIERLGTATPVERIPLVGAAPAAATAGDGDGRTVAFVGNFTHGPNVDAAQRLVRSILPRVRSTRPEARLLLVGEGSDRLRLACDAVAATGRVQDTEHALAGASAVVLPLALGGGMRVKLQEALAGGRAVVASRLAASGLDVTDGRELLLADDDESFARGVAELLENADRRRALAEAALEWSRRSYDPAAVARAFLALYERVRATPPRRRTLMRR